MINPKEEKTSKAKKPPSGGSSTIEVEEVEVEPSAEPKELPDEEPLEEGELTEDALLEVNRAMVETAAMVVGRTAVLITKIEEMAFDEDETNQLVALWSPILPKLTPLVAAIIGTSIIIGGKVGTYYALKEPKKSEAEKAAKE